LGGRAGKNAGVRGTGGKLQSADEKKETAEKIPRWVQIRKNVEQGKEKTTLGEKEGKAKGGGGPEVSWGNGKAVRAARWGKDTGKAIFSVNFGHYLG